MAETCNIERELYRAFLTSGTSIKRLSMVSRTSYASCHGYFGAARMPGKRGPTAATLSRWLETLGLTIGKAQ